MSATIISWALTVDIAAVLNLLSCHPATLTHGEIRKSHTVWVVLLPQTEYSTPFVLGNKRVLQTTIAAVLPLCCMYAHLAPCLQRENMLIFVGQTTVYSQLGEVIASGSNLSFPSYVYVLHISTRPSTFSTTHATRQKKKKNVQPSPPKLKKKGTKAHM